MLLAAAAVLLAAVGLLVILYAQPAEVTFPGKPGKLAYVGYDGNDTKIYTINAGGGSKLQLTDNSTSDSDPDYSPSGKKIAYTGGAGGDDELYTIKVGGGGKHQVTDNGIDDYEPSWGSN